MKRNHMPFLITAFILVLQSCSSGDTDDLSRPTETSNKREVRITLDLDLMIRFFSSDSEYGSKDKPYVSDEFMEVDLPEVKYISGNILQYEADKEYVVTMEEKLENGESSMLVETSEKRAEITEDYVELAMITDKQYSKEQWNNLWKQYFVWNETTMEIKEGKLYVYEQEEAGIVIKTQAEVTPIHHFIYKLFYHAEVQTEEGIKKRIYGLIDPVLKNLD